MTKPQKVTSGALAIIAGQIAIAIALIWAVALLGGGIWQLLRRPPVRLDTHSPVGETFAQVRNVPAGLFSYRGSNTWAPIRLKVDSAIQSQQLGFQLRFAQAHTDTAIQKLIADRVSFVQSDRPIAPAEYRQAEQRGFNLKQIPVAIDGIAIAVHPSFNITGLTIAELRGIYTGAISNWQALGGPDMAIAVFSSPKTDGTAEFFSNEILGSKKFAAKVEFVPTTTQAIRRLSQTPGGIYYASASTLVPQCSIKTVPIGQGNRFINPQKELGADCLEQRNQVNLEAFGTGKYPIARYLYVVIKENKALDSRAGKAYADLLLTEQGQAAIAEAGFVPIR